MPDYCPSCGNELDGSPDYCPDCGEQLSADSGTSVESAGDVSVSNSLNVDLPVAKQITERRHVGPGILLVLAVVLLVGGGIYFGYVPANVQTMTDEVRGMLGHEECAAHDKTGEEICKPAGAPDNCYNRGQVVDCSSLAKDVSWKPMTTEDGGYCYTKDGCRQLAQQQSEGQVTDSQWQQLWNNAIVDCSGVYCKIALAAGSTQETTGSVDRTACDQQTPRFTGQDVYVDQWAFTGTNEIALRIEAVTQEVTVTEVTIEWQDQSPWAWHGSKVIKAGQGGTVTIQGSGAESGGCLAGDVRIKFDTEQLSGVTATGEGKLQGTVP